MRRPKRSSDSRMRSTLTMSIPMPRTGMHAPEADARRRARRRRTRRTMLKAAREGVKRFRGSSTARRRARRCFEGQPGRGTLSPMQDLTTGSVTRHLLKTTSFMLVTMLFQTLYFLVDLYWVGRLGKESVAAVGVAGNLMFISLALTQMLGVGCTTLISHAAGRKDRDRALLVFNQALVLSVLAGVAYLVLAMSV